MEGPLEVDEKLLADLIQILASHFEISDDEIKPESAFRADLGFDSIALFELYWLLEEASGLPLNMDAFPEDLTVLEFAATLSAAQHPGDESPSALADPS